MKISNTWADVTPENTSVTVQNSFITEVPERSGNRLPVMWCKLKNPNIEQAWPYLQQVNGKDLPYICTDPCRRSFSQAPFWGQKNWQVCQDKHRSWVPLPVLWLGANPHLSRPPSTWKGTNMKQRIVINTLSCSFTNLRGHQILRNLPKF